MNTQHPKSENTDVAIIGAGPVGSYAALNLAKLGVDTTVFEEHSQIGLPSHCAGHISIRSLKNFNLYPLPTGIIENTFCAANFNSPQGTKFTLHLSCPVTLSLDRTRFDQYLAGKAQAAGTRLVLGSRVLSLLKQGGCVEGLTIMRENGAQQKMKSKIVLDAEGISSRLLRQAGLSTIKNRNLVYAVETEIENAQDIEENTVEVYFGKSYAPGFYGWLIPKSDGRAKLGLATNQGNPKTFLNRLITKHPIASKQLANAKFVKTSYHAISLGGPIEKVYTDGFLAMGDCASQVKPTTGGGVIFGITCAREAAEVANIALRENDFSARVLQTYQKRCERKLNFDFYVMLRMRHFLDSLSDERIDEMLRVCGKLGLDKVMRDVDEIDYQGRLLLTALGKPQMLAAFAYFGLLYLSANP